MFKHNENKNKYEHIMLNALEKTGKSNLLHIQCSQTIIMFKIYEHNSKPWGALVRSLEACKNTRFFNAYSQ